MHVPLCRREVLMSGQLLNRSCWRATHRQVRAERVTQPVGAAGWNACVPPGLAHTLANDVLSERRAIVQTEHPRTLQMTMLPEGRRESCRHRHVPQSPALGNCDVAPPFRSLNAHLSLGQINVAPLQANHLAAAQTCFAAEQHHQVRRWPQVLRRFEKPLVLIEVIERPSMASELAPIGSCMAPVRSRPTRLPFLRERSRPSTRCSPSWALGRGAGASTSGRHQS